MKPYKKELKDPWTYKIEGGLLPSWLTRAAKGKKDFWRADKDLEHNSGIAQGVERASSSDEGLEKNEITRHAKSTGVY